MKAMATTVTFRSGRTPSERRAGGGMVVWWHRLLIAAFLAGAITMSGCASGGRVLHVDNGNTVPYSIVDMKLKRRIMRALVRRKLITRAQQYTCQVNIMEIGRYYVLEVWPNGINAAGAFGVKLKKPLLIPVEKYTGTR